MSISARVQIVFGGSTVLQRPKLATLIGGICSEWSFTEQMLANVFAMLVTGEVLSGDLTAIESFESIGAFSQKLKTLGVAVTNRLPDALATEIGCLLGDLGKLSEQRNRVVHGRWALSDAYPSSLIWVKRTSGNMHKGAEVYNEARLQDILDRIIDTRTHALTIVAVKVTPLLKPPSKALGKASAPEQGGKGHRRLPGKSAST